MINNLDLRAHFENIFFIDKTHTYKIDNVLAKYSVTSLIKKYTPEFDEKTMSKIIADKRSVSVEDILEEWAYKRDYSCHKGSEFHKFAENYFARKQISIDESAIKGFLKSKNSLNLETDFKSYKLEMANMVSNFLNFYDWYKESYSLVESEFVVGDASKLICGTIDNLSLNKKTGKLAIFDYKTNQNLKKIGYKKQTLLPPFNHIQNCELSKYSLQLWMYKLILETNSPFEVGDLYIVWVTPTSGYELISAENYEEEAHKILNFA